MQKEADEIRIVVIDDDPSTRSRIREAVSDESDLTIVGEAFSAGEGVILIQEELPDVVVADLAVQGSRGLDFVRSIRAGVPDVHVVVCSSYPEAEYAARCIRAGALGYVLKTAAIDTILDAIRSVARQEAYVSRRAMMEILTRMLKGDTNDPFDKLTTREMTVFELLGEQYATATIADELGLSRKTVEVYRRRIREKLGLSSVGELLAYATRWKSGDVMRSPNES